MRDPQARFPVVYLPFPSAKDPSFPTRFPGRATIEAIAPASYEWFTRWADSRWQRRGPEYEELKARLAERLLGHLYAAVPAVRGKVNHAELSTPLSTRHFMGYARGETYGLSPTPDRFRLRLGAQSPIPGLFLAGQDLSSLGVVGALFGGALAASSVLRRNVLRQILK